MEKNIQKLTIIKTILVLSFAILPLLGTDCNSNTIGGGSGGDITGTWKLNFIQGNLQDVCLGEVVTFPTGTSGTATLTCPGSTSISRTYDYSNAVLTYTETQVKYNVDASNSSVMILTGVNFGRTLTYGKVPADDNVSSQTPESKNTSNSSEIKSK
jgi:hypothetical protein